EQSDADDQRHPVSRQPDGVHEDDSHSHGRHDRPRDHESASSHAGHPAHRPITFATVAPISAGLLTTVTPASWSAFIFSAAVPLPPAMIAPACPIRRPGGAVWPAMKPTTGFLTLALMKLAASSSAVPPISPIMITALVSWSAANSRRASMNEVPISGSP